MRPTNIYHYRQTDCTVFQIHNPKQPNFWYHPAQVIYTTFRIYNSDDQLVISKRANVSSLDLHTIPTIDLYYPN